MSWDRGRSHGRGVRCNVTVTYGERNYGFNTNDESHDGHTLHDATKGLDQTSTGKQAAEEAAGVQQSGAW